MRNNKKITVMHVIPAFALAGAEKIAFSLATRMNKDNFNTIICSVHGDNLKMKKMIFADLHQHGIQTISLGKPDYKNRLTTLFRLYRHMVVNQVDIVHTHCDSPDFYGKLSAFFAGTPLAFSTIHSVEGYKASYEKFLNLFTTKYVAISTTVKQFALSRLKIPAQKVETIHNAVDTDLFARSLSDSERDNILKDLGISKDRKIVTTTGRVTALKGHRYLIEAAKLVLNHKQNVHFLLVGDITFDPEYGDALKAKVKQSQLADRISFTGIRNDIPEILSITDLFVLPSLWEGLSVALLEAMSAGVPIIATNVGSNPEIISSGENGLLVPPKDSSALAERIINLLSNPSERKKIGKNGQATVNESFSIDRMVDAHEELYVRHMRAVC